MGLRAGQDWCGKSRPIGIRSPDRLARRQSLYRLSYRAHHYVCTSSYYRIYHYICSRLFQTMFCYPKEMSHTTALSPFTSYEQWTKNDIVPSAGSGRKLIPALSSRRVRQLTAGENGYARSLLPFLKLEPTQFLFPSESRKFQTHDLTSPEGIPIPSLPQNTFLDHLSQYFHHISLLIFQMHVSPSGFHIKILRFFLFRPFVAICPLNWFSI